MDTLNLPSYEFNIRQEGRSTEIFDTIRRKFVALTPEEWVRQNFIRFLVGEKKYPSGRIAIEIEIRVNRMKKRCDAVVFDPTFLKPLLIIECKAPSVSLKQEVFDQAAGYNRSLQVEYFAITNGLQHFFCRINMKEERYDFMKEIPFYDFFKLNF